MQYEKLGKLLASKYRIIVFSSLNKKTMTPLMLSKENKIAISHVSKTLKELEKLDLIKCKTPALKKGRLYSVTNEGKKINNLLKQVN